MKYRCSECGAWFDSKEELNHKKTTCEEYYGVAGDFPDRHSLTVTTCPCCGEEADFKEYEDEEFEIIEIEDMIKKAPWFVKGKYDIDYLLFEDVEEGRTPLEKMEDAAKILYTEGMKEMYEYLYPKGTKVEVLFWADQKEPNYPRGIKGIVDFVDDACGVHTNWENGGSIAFLPLAGDTIQIL